MERQDEQCIAKRVMKVILKEASRRWGRGRLKYGLINGVNVDLGSKVIMVKAS